MPGRLSAREAGADSSLPKVLIIGDSISLGYTPLVIQAMKGKAVVKHNPGNAQHSGTGVKKIDAWLGKTPWDVIHFNWGLWDLCYRNPKSKVQGRRDKVNGTVTLTPQQYAKNLDAIVTRLKKTGAVLIWASTTVVPKGEAGRKLGDDRIYNDVAAAVMKRRGVAINDLHSLTKGFEASFFVAPGNVHFTRQGSARLAGQVVQAIEKALVADKPGPAAGGRQFYVATDGDDANPGTKGKPFATLVRARNAVRQAIKTAKESVTVFLRGGEYHLSETVVFSLADSAPAGCTITYSAYPGEKPVLGSGVRITGWKKLAAPPATLPARARPNVWVAEVPKGLTLFRTLYDGRKRLPRASIGFCPTSDPKGKKGYPVVNENYDVLRELAFPKGVLRAWSNLSDVEVAIRPHNAWVMNILTLESVDEQAFLAKTTLPGTYALNRPVNVRPGGISAWVQNVLEGLDAPGRWAVNTRQGKVTLWPSGASPGEKIMAPCLRELIRIEGDIDIKGPADKPVRGLVFKGLTFSLADRGTWTKDDAGIQHDWEMVDKADALVRFRGAEQCQIVDCTFTNSGGSAVRLDLHCRENRIAGNEISNIGGAGILLIGYGPGTKDVNKGNTVVDNHIHDIGQLYWHSHAIVAWQSGSNRIANNYIHHCPRKAVCLSGVRPGFFWPGRKGRRECSRTIRRHEVGDKQEWADILPFLHTRNNVVEHNEIHHVLQMLGDGAAVNVSGAGTGNVIRRNYIHDIENPACASCIRTDDAQAGTRVEENIVFRAKIGGVTPKRENHFVNNFLIDVGPGGDAIHTSGKWGPFGTSRIERNILITSGQSDRFWGGFRAEHVAKLSGCTIDRNIYFRPASQSPAATRSEKFLAALRAKGHDAASHYGDPLLVDYKNGDFRFRPDSPAIKMGIVPLDLTTVGLTKDFPKRLRSRRTAQP